MSATQIPRFHKACVFNAGRRIARTRGHLATFERAALFHKKAGHLTEGQFQVVMELPGWLNLRGGRCDPSHRTIGNKANVKVKTVQRALGTAKRLGLIGWDQRARRIGGETIQITNQYQILPGLAAATEAPAVSACPPEQPITEDIKSISCCSDSVSPLERALAALGRAIAQKDVSTTR